MKNRISFQIFLTYFVTCLFVLPLHALDEEPILGDFDNDQQLTFADVDILTLSGDLGAEGYDIDDTTEIYDLDFNGIVNQDDVFLLITWITFVDPVTDFISNCEVGDYTGDGVVDLSDWHIQNMCYVYSIYFQGIWVFRYTTGDANGDGVIDAADYQVLCNNWTSGTCPSIPILTND